MPVICISAATMNDDWQKYQKAGMNAYLAKPFTEEMLLTTILSVIKDYLPLNISEQVSRKIIKPEGPDKINLQNLYHISGGDEQFAKQMLISFIDSTGKGLNEMLYAVRSGEFNQVAELAHKILPPARHIGASDEAWDGALVCVDPRGPLYVVGRRASDDFRINIFVVK